MQRDVDQSFESRPMQFRYDSTEIIGAKIITIFYSVAVYGALQSLKNVSQLSHYSADSHQSQEMNALTAG